MLIFLCWLCSVTFTFWHGEHREIFLRVFSLSIFFKFIKAMQMLKNPIDIIICLKTFVNITTALNKCVYKTCTWMGHNLSRRPSKVIHISAIEFWCFPHSSLLCFFHWSWRKKIEKDEVRRKAAAVGKKKKWKWKTVIFTCMPQGKGNHHTFLRDGVSKWTYITRGPFKEQRFSVTFQLCPK